MIPLVSSLPLTTRLEHILLSLAVNPSLLFPLLQLLAQPSRFIDMGLDMAKEVARALLMAMNTEETFQLLRTLPERLKELSAIESQTAPIDVRNATPLISS